METCIKIIELSSVLGNLNKYLITNALVLLVLTILFLLRNKIGIKQLPFIRDRHTTSALVCILGSNTILPVKYFTALGHIQRSVCHILKGID